MPPLSWDGVINSLCYAARTKWCHKHVAWDVGNVLFPTCARTKCRSNRNCTPIEDLINVIVYHNYMKDKGLWHIENQNLLQFRAEDSDPFFSHLPSEVHAVHDLNAYVISHFDHREKLSLTYLTIIWLYTIRSDISLYDRILQKLTGN